MGFILLDQCIECSASLIYCIYCYNETSYSECESDCLLENEECKLDCRVDAYLSCVLDL